MSTDTVDGTPPVLPVDVVVPAWGEYVQRLPGAVDSAAGATVIAVVEAADRQTAAQLGCRTVLRPPGGLGAARNAGARAGDSPAVLFLDADDRLVAGALTHLTRRLAAAPRRCVAVSGELRRRSTGTTWPPARRARACCWPGGGPALLWRNLLPAVGATLMRRSALPPDGLFPDLEDEDWHAIIRLRSCGSISFRRGGLLDYDDRPGSVSRRPRDPAALAASRDALWTSARGTAVPWLWRVADVAARPSRRRADRALLAQWGDAR